MMTICSALKYEEEWEYKSRFDENHWDDAWQDTTTINEFDFEFWILKYHSNLILFFHI